MSNKTEIRLTSVNLSSQQEIDTLLEAANELQNASEANFKHMQDKKWYKRLWEMITFSKDNQKVMAKNVASLADMQDIIIKALLMASRDERAISDYLAQSSGQLEKMAKNQTRMAQAIAEIKYGHDPRPDIRELGVEHQFVIVSSILKFVTAAVGDRAVDGEAQTYISNLQSCCNPIMNPQIHEFDYKKINYLSVSGHKLLAYILTETAALLNDNEQKPSAFSEIKRYIGISDMDFEAINSKVSDAVKLQGKNFIMSRYAGMQFMDDDLFIIGDGEIDFEVPEQTHNYSEDSRTPRSDFIDGVLPDTTQGKYAEIRAVILNHLPNINAFWNDIKPQKHTKKISAYIEKNALPIEKDTVIALVDTTVLGDGTEGLLFTTHAVYYKKIFEKETVKMPYSRIDYLRCKLCYNKKGKSNAISIALRNKIGGSDEIVIDEVINNNVMLDIINDLGKLAEYAPTDSPRPIAEMDHTVKLPYIKLLTNLLTNSNHSCAELFRMAWDIGLSNDEVAELYQYTKCPQDSIANILTQINHNAPYGSVKSLRYALILDMFSQLQFITHESNVDASAHELIQKITKAYGFSNDDVFNLKKVAQTRYDILTGKIKYVKELDFLQKALRGLGGAAGIPLVTVLGSSFLFWRTMWFIFIPGVGFILGSILGGLGIAAAIINKNKNDARFSEERKEMVAKENYSYTQAIDNMSKFGHIGQYPAFEKEISILKENKRLLT